MPTLLVVTASPLDLDRLRLGNEVKQIKRALERSRHRDSWTIETNEAATVDDLRRALLDHRPQVVHFCGHGGGDSGLAFEADDGASHDAHAAPLTRLFHHFKDSLKCVVLNACYSEVQAAAIRQQVDYVVGMSSSISDDAATKFSVAFYDAVFANTTFRQAFDLACTTIDLHNLGEADVPVLLTGPAIGSDTLTYTATVPVIEDLLLSYLNASHEEKYRFTAEGDSIRDVMSRFYASIWNAPVDKVVVTANYHVTENHLRVRITRYAKGASDARNYYIRLGEGNPRVEWKASVGFWSVPPKTYLALGSATPVVARVRAALGNSYYGEFHDKGRTVQAIDLYSAEDHHFYGYVRRHMNEGKRLIELLSDGRERDVTLSIGKVCQDTECPLIYDVLSESWLYDENSSAE
ncbi:MAG: CHAT domain-containing protein [Lacipirellulaceae bacterium]